MPTTSVGCSPGGLARYNSLPCSQQLTRPLGWVRMARPKGIASPGRIRVADRRSCDGGPSEESGASEESVHKNGEVSGIEEICSGEDISSGESESGPE
ncbi:hypothetical protein Tco_0114642 [Tanacetum coccineum]